MDVSGPGTAPDLSAPLRAGLSRLRTVTGVDGTMGGIVDRGGRFVITENHHMLVNAFQNTVVAPGAGIGGRALALGRSVVINDYLQAATISHQYDSQVQRERIHGSFAIPVRVGARPRALVYGVTRTPHALGDRVLETAAGVVGRLALELAVEIEVADRLQRIAQESRRAQPPLDVREVHEELQAIAATTSDLVVRERLTLMCDRLAPDPETHQRPNTLAPRERDVISAIALGMTNSEVAEHLSLMPSTVKSYMQSAMRKLGTRNRVETISAAQRAG